MIYVNVAPKVKHPTLAENASVEPYFKSDMVHIMLELEYILASLPNLETYCLLHHF
jgi:hypothetical protein